MQSWRPIVLIWLRLFLTKLVLFVVVEGLLQILFPKPLLELLGHITLMNFTLLNQNGLGLRDCLEVVLSVICVRLCLYLWIRCSKFDDNGAEDDLLLWVSWRLHRTVEILIRLVHFFPFDLNLPLLA